MRATFFTIFITLIHKARSGPTPDNDVTLRVQDSCKSDGSSSCGSDQWNGSELSDMNAGSEACGFLFTQWNEESAPCSAAHESPRGHSPYALIGQLSKMVFGRSHQRPPRHTLPQIVSTDKSSAFDVQFQKCAEIITESEVPQIKLYLVVKIPEDGNDLSQLTIHDTIADIISLETNGHIEGNVYQVFSKDTLPAGSSYVAMYNASVKGSWNEVLFLPAFLNFSNESQNDINLFGPAVFGPLVANFTLRIDTTEKVCVDHALHFAWFCVAFLISTLLLSLTLLTSACCYIYCCTHTPKHTMQRRQRRSFSREAEPDEAFCNAGESANEEAAFEEGIIDIMALEDPQNMLHSLNRLELSTMAHASVTLERTRVQMLKGVFRVLTSAAGMSKKDVGVLDLLSYVTDMEEDRQARLNTHYSTETHTWAQDLERQCWQRRTVLRRREELHSIISEELEETMMGETRTANRILHQYYTCQEQLEAGLDLFVANQRAALSERQAQRRFLVQGLKDLQLSVCDVFSVFSQHVHSWFTQIHREGVLSDQQCMEQLEFSQSELLHAKRTLEERLSRERGSAHCDMIKARRAHISEMVCEQKREQQDLMSVCEGRLDEYLLRWQTLLCAHNTQLSELITHLDREAAARMREVLLCALRDAAADLKQVECTICESLQEMGVPRRLLLQMRAGSVVGGAMAEAETQLAVREREAAKALRITRSRIHPIREQELREQRERRAKTQTFCRSVCEGQPSLSERDLLRVQLECVKCECHLDRLLFPHTLSTKQRTGQTSDPTYGHALNAPLSVTAHTQQACVCEDEAGVRSECEERVAMQVASLLWEKLERKNRVLDTHSALLTLHTMLLQSVTHGPAGDELAHTIHTHRLALEEAELQLQKEESEWEESLSGCGYDKLVSSHDGGMFRVDTECSVTECLRVALCKREQLAHNLSERLRMELRRQQVMEDLREQHELKRLYTHCDQDLLLTAVLVKLVGVSVPVLQQLLHLLLPTVPEGELQSLIHTLVPNEGQTLDVSSDLVDTLRRDIISRNLSPCSQTHTDRMQKKKLKLQQKLFTPHPDDSTRPMTAAAEEDAPLVGGARSDEAGDTAGAVGAATEGERLFTVCPQPTADKETADTSDPSQKRKKKRRFTLKKGTVAPLEQT